MRRPLARLTLRTPADVVAARQRAHRLAELVGFDRSAQTRIATAVSEVSRNAFVHAGGGSVEFDLQGEGVGNLLTVVVVDQGAGIADLDSVLSGQRTYAPGHGNGLTSARRLIDQFDVETGAAGTTVRMAQRIPRAVATRIDRAALEAQFTGATARAEDPSIVVQEQNRELIDSLNELQERQNEARRLNAELEETNRGVVALYSELDQRAEQLRVVSEMKTRFLSHMSHEFRTPLNSILALTRLMLDRVDGDLNSEQAKQVEYMRRSAQELLEMVNDLLDLAKVEAGRLDVRATTFDVPGLFASLRGSLKPLLTNPEVELVFDEPGGLPELFADEAKVTQVLRNFVSNALKFTERGHVRVAARLDVVRQRIAFSVEDTGIGIAADGLEMIFHEFTQIDGRLQRGGTGLGLPLSRRLAQLMGGDVVARSALDQGSTFELWLPVRFGQKDQDPASERLRLLVVDDEEAFRYVIRHIAQDAGYEVIEAVDGEECMRMIEEQKPDLIVLDLQLPAMDGFAVLERMATAGLSIPVVVCTSQLLSLEQRRALAAAYAIVPKHDLSRDALTALIRSASENSTERGASA
jgi:signal transduction histidine kinase